jgi:hypothetical protein
MKLDITLALMAALNSGQPHISQHSDILQASNSLGMITCNCEALAVRMS